MLELHALSSLRESCFPFPALQYPQPSVANGGLVVGPTSDCVVLLPCAGGAKFLRAGAPSAAGDVELSQ